MEERRVSRRGPVTTLRVVGGTIAVVAPFALGLIGHSPWKALLLVPAFAASYALSRTRRPVARADALAGTIGTVLSIGLVHLVLVGSLYLIGLGLGELFGDVLPVDPLGTADLLFVAIVWAVTLACALTSRRLERRRTYPGPED